MVCIWFDLQLLWLTTVGGWLPVGREYGKDA
jgi:hypothetical protein